MNRNVIFIVAGLIVVLLAIWGILALQQPPANTAATNATTPAVTEPAPAANGTEPTPAAPTN